MHTVSQALSAPATFDSSARAWVLALTSLASFMVALDALVVTTALRQIGTSLGAPLGTLEWVVNAYQLSFAVLLLTGAALGDRFGRRRVMATGLLVFIAGSVGCALARDATWLIAARALQGVGAAMVMPVAMALIGAAFPREERAKALGIFGSITGLALIVGPALGGAIAEGWAWPWIFWINVPIGLVAVWLLRERVEESHGPSAGIDMPGAVLATLAALAVVWAMVRGHGAGWQSPEVMLAVPAGGLLSVGFVVWQRHAPAPMVPLAIFRARGVAAGLAASFLFYAPMYGTVFFLPQFLQSQGQGPWGAGLRLLPWTATLMVTAPLAGSLVRRLGERPLVVVGVLLQALGLGWIAWVAEPTLPYVQLVLPLLISGVGVSMAMPAAQNAVISAVPPEQIGKASGVFNMARYLGGTFGVALLVEVFSRTSNSAPSQAFNHAMAAAAALSLLGAAAALALPPRLAPSSGR